MSDEKKELAALLAPYGQEHLLRFWDQLSPEEKGNLSSQIRGINWENVMHWYREVTEGGGSDGIPFDADASAICRAASG